MRRLKHCRRVVYFTCVLLFALGTGCARCNREMRVHFEEDTNSASRLVYSYYVDSHGKVVKHGEFCYWDLRAGTLHRTKYCHGKEVASEIIFFDEACGPSTGEENAEKSRNPERGKR